MHYGVQIQRFEIMEFKKQALNQIASEMNLFEETLRAALEIPSGLTRTYNHILISGMGASTIGGMILVDAMYYSSDIRIEVLKTMNLPSWIDENTLLVACSYSGNTYETLQIYNQAISAGIDVIAVTHGGKLEELSEKNGNLIIKIGGTPMLPRSAIGWFLGLIGGIIEDAGGPQVRSQLADILPSISQYTEEFTREGNYAWVIASRIEDKIPVVYAPSNLSAMALRMKNQFNENSKMIAFSGILPEFNHNEIVGWYDDDHKYLFHPILIVDEDSEEIAKIIKATDGLLTSRDVGLDIFKVKGKSVLEKNIYAIMFGDYVSLYLAAMRNVDPDDRTSIEDLKERMREVLSCRKLPSKL